MKPLSTKVTNHDNHQCKQEAMTESQISPICNVKEITAKCCVLLVTTLKKQQMDQQRKK
jgi:hypothetical protein